MVSIPDSPTKRQDAIENSPSTLAEAEAIIAGLRQEAVVKDEMLQAKDELLLAKDKQIGSLEEEVDGNQDSMKDLRDQLTDMYQRIDVYVQEEIYRHTLFANPDLSSSEKLVLLSSRGVVRELRADDDTSLTDFHLNTIAQQTGLTNETVGKKLKRLDDVFNTVEYKTEKVFAGKDKDGKRIFVSDTKLALLPLVDQPQMIQLPNGAPRQGGPREKKICPVCKSDKIQRATHTSCLNCKHTLELTVHMVNEESVGLEQSDADALFMLSEAVQDASLSLTDETPLTTICDPQKCTCTHSSKNHHDVIPIVASVESVPSCETQETPEYKPAWKCNCRDSYKGWYWSSSVKLWRCTGCHKDASETRQKAVL